MFVEMYSVIVKQQQQHQNTSREKKETERKRKIQRLHSLAIFEMLCAMTDRMSIFHKEDSRL